VGDEPRWIKPAVSCYAPRCIVSVICETETTYSNDELRQYTCRLKRLHVSESHRKSHRWSDTAYHSFNTGYELMDWLESTRSTERKTYLFTPSVIETLTLMNAWNRLEESGCVLSRELADSQAPVGKPLETVSQRTTGTAKKSYPSHADPSLYHFSTLVAGVNAQIVKYRRNHRSMQWCSHSQYTQSSEDVIATSIGHRWRIRLYNDTSINQYIHSPHERAEMWCSFYRELCDWWIAIDGGPWGQTTAAMAYNFLKHRLAEHTILKHDNASVGMMEDDAIIGGRRTTWYFGNIGIPEEWDSFEATAPLRSEHGAMDCSIHHSDVRSMYPYLLAEMDYPIRHAFTLANPSRGEILDALCRYGVVARCQLNTPIPEYPLRTESSLKYPTGAFRTVLAGPELAQALCDGVVQHVYSAAVYIMGRPFASACGSLLAMREKYRSSNDSGWEMFVKLLSNSMSGKLAQNQYSWTAVTDISPLADWGPWLEENPLTQEIEHYRSIAGMTWKRTLAKTCVRPMGAAYSYLTSYGRVYMRWVRNMCPVGSVVSQDTDGIWTTAQALSALYSHSSPLCEDSGSLHVDKAANAARFFGPQQYWYAGKWVLSGQSLPTVYPGESKVASITTKNNLLYSDKPPAPEIVREVHMHSLGMMYVDGSINEYGWRVPSHIYDTDPTISPWNG